MPSSFPARIRAHSTTAQETSSLACFRNVPVAEICKATPWSNPLTFVKQYTFEMAARADSKFRRVVLLSICLISCDSSIPPSHCLPVTYSGIHTDSSSKNKELLPYCNCSASGCCSQYGCYNPPSVPTFRVLSEHRLWNARELREGCIQPTVCPRGRMCSSNRHY